MPFCVVPFYVTPICVMHFCVMPICVKPICVMPIRVMPTWVMPYMHDTWNGFYPSASVGCIHGLEHRIGSLLFSFGLMHVQFGSFDIKSWLLNFVIHMPPYEPVGMTVEWYHIPFPLFFFGWLETGNCQMLQMVKTFPLFRSKRNENNYLCR